MITVAVVALRTVRTLVALMVVSAAGCGTVATEPLLPFREPPVQEPPDPDLRPVLVYADGPWNSRYLLYGDSIFTLEYPAAGISGRYSRDGSLVHFAFFGTWSGPASATGEVRGDSMFVSYSPVMSLSDFEDGVYVRSAASTLPWP